MWQRVIQIGLIAAVVAVVALVVAKKFPAVSKSSVEDNILTAPINDRPILNR